YVRMLRGMRLLAAGACDEAERTIREAVDVWRGSPPLAATGYFFAQMLHLRVMQNRAEYLTECRAVFGFVPDPAILAPLAVAHHELGHVEDARALFERLTADESFTRREDVIWVIACVQLADVCAALRRADVAERLYATLAPYARYWSQLGEA